MRSEKGEVLTLNAIKINPLQRRSVLIFMYVSQWIKHSTLLLLSSSRVRSSSNQNPSHLPIKINVFLKIVFVRFTQTTFDRPYNALIPILFPLLLILPPSCIFPLRMFRVLQMPTIYKYTTTISSCIAMHMCELYAQFI